LFTPEVKVAVYPFTRQAEGEEIVIGRVDTGVFLSLPPDAVEILDLLRAGETVGRAREIYGQKYGETPDMEDFLGFLHGKGFVRVHDPNEPVRARPAEAQAAVPNSQTNSQTNPQAQVPAASTVRYHFADFPVSLARKLFGTTALAIGAVIFALAVAAAILDPSVRPHRDSLVFSQHRTLKTLGLMMMGYTTVFIHEMGHLIAARAVGVSSRLGISSRMWVLVAETDMTGLWSVPKRQRYLPMLAGPVIDVVSASLITLVLFGHHQGWIALHPVAVELGSAMVVVYLLRLLWQCFFFVRTDFYYVIAAFFGCKNLMKDTQVHIRNLSRRFFGNRPAVDQSSIPEGERRVIRSYAWVWLLGRVAAMWMLFFVTLPVAGQYIRASGATLMAGFSGDSYAFLDALFIVVFYLFPLGLGMGLWIRGLIKQRRLPSEREQTASIA
jgi:putative peptide zinc metalloprotease protein